MTLEKLLSGRHATNQPINFMLKNISALFSRGDNVVAVNCNCDCKCDCYCHCSQCISFCNCSQD